MRPSLSEGAPTTDFSVGQSEIQGGFSGKRLDGVPRHRDRAGQFGFQGELTVFELDDLARDAVAVFQGDDLRLQREQGE